MRVKDIESLRKSSEAIGNIFAAPRKVGNFDATAEFFYGFDEIINYKLPLRVQFGCAPIKESSC